ncbi:MAG: hypothetical protein ABSD88_10305 [Candidatus Korobacteraceae bacterium]|jgi:hypothetical protein
MTNKVDFRGFEKACMQSVHYYAIRAGKIFEITGFAAVDNSSHPSAVARARVGTIPLIEQSNAFIDPAAVTDWKTLATIFKYPPLGVPEALGELLKKIEEWYPVAMKKAAAVAPGKE